MISRLAKGILETPHLMKFLGSVACTSFPFHLKEILIGQGREETLRRLHCAPSLESFKDKRTGTTCTPKDCPGIEPASMNQYPQINSLLSIPFSLLSNLPRFRISISKESSSKYQRGPRQNGTRNIGLWCWSPPDKNQRIYPAERINLRLCDPLPPKLQNEGST